MYRNTVVKGIISTIHVEKNIDTLNIRYEIEINQKGMVGTLNFCEEDLYETQLELMRALFPDLMKDQKEEI
jgi:hypothetical protein